MLNMRLASCGFLLILLISAIPGTALAGSWTTYTDAGYVSGLAARGNDLWAGTNGGVLHWDLVAGTYVKYTTSEGLADQIVKEALIDVAGNRWFGTTEGVQKFDGAVWTTYNTSNSPLPNNTVYAIAQDLVGTMWFGTAFGCASFDGVDWEVFTNLGGGATNVAVRGIGVDSQNHIWTANNPSNYGDPGGVSMYDGSLWTRYDPDPRSIGQYFLSLAVDLHDGVWAGSWTNWVFMYDGSSWTHYDSGNSGLVGTNIEYVAVEDDNTVWIANHAASPTPTTGGVARYDGSWTTYTPANSGLPDRYVYSIAPGNGEVYFGTGSSGCAGFDGVSWDYYVTSNDPHTQWTTSIARGTVGPRGANTYFGTEYYGIAIFDGNDWSSYTTDNSGLGDNYINDVHVSDGILWTGSQYSGLYKFDGAGWVNYHTGNSGLLGNMILSIDTDSQGNLWLGTSGWDGPMGQDGALAKFDGTSWTNYYLSNSSLIDDDCLQVAVDATDMIWIGTEEGVSKFDGGSNWTNYDTGNSGLIENHVQAIAFGLDNSTWFATWGGVSHLSGLDWVSYTTADGLPSNTIRDICVTGADVVWVATAAGAASFEGGIWTAHTQTAGLADDDVTATGVESDDRIWFGTRKSGISVYDGGFTAVAGSEVLAPSFGLLGNYPNPFNPSTSIRFRIPEAGPVLLAIYDVAGRRVAVLASGHHEAGEFERTWNGTDENGTPVGSGVYLCRLASGGGSETTKLILLK